MPDLRDDLGSHIVTWPDVHRDAKMLVRRLLDRGPWKGIVALARGGLVPASIVAREMDNRLIDTLCIATYELQDRGEARVIKGPEQALADRGAGWLLVDDLVDTGTTLRKARELLPEAYFATVYAKPNGLPLVDTHVHEVDQDVWVFFPWDTGLQYVSPLAAKE